MTRQLIVAAAERVLYREGWIAATMDEIAREAGLTKGGVLYYYRTKNELLASAVELRRQRRMADTHAKVTENKTSSAKVILLAWFEFILADKDYIHNLISMTADTELRLGVMEARKKMYQECCACGTDPVKVAEVFTLIEGVLLDLFHEESAYPDEVREQWVERIRQRIEELG